MSGFANQLSNGMFLLFILGIPVYAAIKKINVFGGNVKITIFLLFFFFFCLEGLKNDLFKQTNTS